MQGVIKSFYLFYKWMVVMVTGVNGQSVAGHVVAAKGIVIGTVLLTRHFHVEMIVRD